MPSLYVHVPFCRSKCAYCAFYSIPISDSNCSLTHKYLDGVAREIEIRSTEAPEGVFSLFLGGGTPTVLNARELEQLLGIIHANYIFSSDHIPGTLDNYVEKTSEANPGTLTREKLEVLYRYGINRISLGVQSFNDSLLRSIGRIHNVQDIKNSIELIREAGIKNLNLDLIFGLPGQTLTDWSDTLKQAVACSPEHLSIYALTLEEDTPMGKKYLTSTEDYYPVKDTDKILPEYTTLPDDDLQADMYDWAVSYLEDNGYKHYEISNFARPGFECRHNLAYWKAKDYIGLGPGAVSCLNGVRTKNKEDITVFYEMIQSGNKGFEPEETEILTKELRISEYIMLGLRTAEGIDLKSFSSEFGADIQDIYREILANYIARGVLSLSDGRLRIHPRYFFVANSILQKFV